MSRTALTRSEHTPFSALTMTRMVHAIANGSHGKVAPLVRIPAHGVEWVKWGLDSGASGIVIPMVQTRDEVEGIVKRARYPPLGERSFGPSVLRLNLLKTMLKEISQLPSTIRRRQ